MAAVHLALITLTFPWTVFLPLLCWACWHLESEGCLGALAQVGADTPFEEFRAALLAADDKEVAEVPEANM